MELMSASLLSPGSLHKSVTNTSWQKIQLHAFLLGRGQVFTLFYSCTLAIDKLQIL